MTFLRTVSITWPLRAALVIRSKTCLCERPLTITPSMPISSSPALRRPSFSAAPLGTMAPMYTWGNTFWYGVNNRQSHRKNWNYMHFSGYITSSTTAYSLQHNFFIIKVLWVDTLEIEYSLYILTGCCGPSPPRTRKPKPVSMSRFRKTSMSLVWGSVGRSFLVFKADHEDKRLKMYVNKWCRSTLTSALQQGFGLQVQLCSFSFGGVDRAQGACVGVVRQGLGRRVCDGVQSFCTGRHFLSLTDTCCLMFCYFKNQNYLCRIIFH